MVSVPSLTERADHLRLYPQKDDLTGIGCPAFLGRRQQHIHFMAETVMEFLPQGGEKAGLTVLLKNPKTPPLLILIALAIVKI